MADTGYRITGNRHIRHYAQGYFQKLRVFYYDIHLFYYVYAETVSTNTKIRLIPGCITTG